MAFLAASAAPSPLYAVYREAWGFSALMLTVVFASYAFALLAALLVFGSLSDHLGRRAVIVAALVLEVLSIGLFWRADSVAWLLAARALQGVATGMATSALSAMLIDLNPTRGPLLSGVAPMLGMGIGALGSSVLVLWAAEPMRLIFELLLVALVLLTLTATRLPDTVERRAGVWRSLVPQVNIPTRARSTLWRIMPLITVGWALSGFYLSLGPTLANLITGNRSPLIGGLLISVLVLSGAGAILLMGQKPAQPLMRASAAVLVGGLLLTLAGMQWHSAWAFFFGTLVAGLGLGAGFSGAVRCLAPLALPHERAGLMSAFFVVNYLAFSVPAIAAGLMAGLVGLDATALGYAALLLLLTALALVTLRPATDAATPR